jgi:hypothetical protein
MLFRIFGFTTIIHGSLEYRIGSELLFPMKLGEKGGSVNVEINPVNFERTNNALQKKVEVLA